MITCILLIIVLCIEAAAICIYETNPPKES